MAEHVTHLSRHDPNQLRLEGIGLQTQDLKCPICLCWMVTGISSCMRGHLFCTSCIHKLSWTNARKSRRRCPVCRSDHDTFARCIVLDKMMEELFLPCENTGCPCFAKGKHLQIHKEVCPHALIPCPLCPASKQQELQAADLWVHCLEKHWNTCLNLSRSSEPAVELTLPVEEKWLILGSETVYVQKLVFDALAQTITGNMYALPKGYDPLCTTEMWRITVFARSSSSATSARPLLETSICPKLWQFEEDRTGSVPNLKFHIDLQMNGNLERNRKRRRLIEQTHQYCDDTMTHENKLGIPYVSNDEAWASQETLHMRVQNMSILMTALII